MRIKNTLLTYMPGIVLLAAAVIIGLLTYQDYGMAWDEHYHREIGITNYDFAVHGSGRIDNFIMKEYGAGFEMPLIFIERKMHITDARDIYLMRHLAAHLFFLVACFFGYVLIYRLFRSQFIACTGFFMLAFMPRIYAHSFFNTKDLPILSMFLICFALLQIAFEKRRWWLFLLLGLATGYATGIRVMGIMLASIILFFLLTDIIMAIVKKEKIAGLVINMLIFLVFFSVTLYAAWPYLWGRPGTNFVKAFERMAHYDWNSHVILMGKWEEAGKLPFYYFPTWFGITTPILWLIAGVGGMIWIATDFVRKPLLFLQNSTERNFIIYLGCFTVPVLMVIALKSVLYDDWRHLYFVYPSFVLVGLYAINKLYQKQYKPLVQAACLVQVAFVSFAMIRIHPVQQVYFNSLVSHKKEYLRTNFDYEYWGAAYMQALEQLAEKHPRETIKICYGAGDEPLGNNIMMLQPRTRQRFQITDCDHADYMITNFRLHPKDYPYPVEYALTIQNSMVVCVYRLTHAENINQPQLP